MSMRQSPRASKQSLTGGDSPTAGAKSGDQAVQLPRPGASSAAHLIDAAVWLFALVAAAPFRLVDSTLGLRVVGHDYGAPALAQHRPSLVAAWRARGPLPG